MRYYSMEQVINFVKDINGCYLILNLLLLICLNLYLKSRNVEKIKTRFILGVAFLASVILFLHMNGIIQSIFQLKYLSMKVYLMVVAITNITALYTINKKIRLGYSIINYTLFILITLIFGATFAVVLGNKIEALYIMDISNAVTLVDLSFVIFILYLIMMSLIYIGYYLFSSHSNIEQMEKNIQENSIKKRNYLENNNKKFKLRLSFWKRTKTKLKKKNSILSPEELLSYKDKNNFYINGVECGIIFEDSNQENIIKNYHILLEDIHAKLVNGFTLEENQLLKSICTKLQVSNLNYIDLHNASILNRVSVEEYNFLKRLMGVQ